jgi:hypothetical protein
MRPVSAPWRCAAYPHTPNASSPRRGAGGTLECLFRDYTGPRRDVRPARAVFPVAVNPVRPSPPLPRHAEHCDNIPMLLECTGTRRRHDCHCAAYGPPVDDTLESARGGGRTTNHYAVTLEATPVRAQDAPRRLGWSTIRQDCRQLHGTARHASTRRKIVRHACKLLPPWPIRGGSSPAAGDTGRRTWITHTLSAFSTILALTSINTFGTWRPGLLSHHACSPPLRAPRCNAIECPEHARRTAPAGTRINPVSSVASTSPSRGRSQRSLLVSVGTTFRTDSWHAR